jgi:hypothetical protein
MLHYFRQNRCISFGFIAAPDITPSKTSQPCSKRFRFYRRMMLSLFGPETFVQVHDNKQVIYLLINKSELAKGNITIKEIETTINKLYEGDYTILHPHQNG